MMIHAFQEGQRVAHQKYGWYGTITYIFRSGERGTLIWYYVQWDCAASEFRYLADELAEI